MLTLLVYPSKNLANCCMRVWKVGWLIGTGQGMKVRIVLLVASIITVYEFVPYSPRLVKGMLHMVIVTERQLAK